MSDNPFAKYDDFINDEYDDDGISGLYADAGDKAPNFDCPMEAVLKVEELVRGVSKNPQTEVKDFARAEFTIVEIKDRKNPIEGGISKLREAGRVGDFSRLPSRSDAANFVEKRGLAETCQRVAAIMGIRPGDISMDLLGMAHEDDGRDLKGELVGVVVDFRKWTSEDNVAWEHADPSKRGVAYEPKYYPVDADGNRVEPKPLSQVL